MNINYFLLGEAVKIYTDLGYTFIEVPWIVNEKSSEATNPPKEGIFVLEDGTHLIGSAEQGFIHVIEQLKPNTKYASISPCFRKGDNRDIYHQEMFMKLELFLYDNDTISTFADGLMDDAMTVFYKLGIHEKALYGVLTHSTNIDLCVQRFNKEMLEIGSYGYRIINDINNTYKINYGTGLALPRFQFGFKEQYYE